MIHSKYQNGSSQTVPFRGVDNHFQIRRIRGGLFPLATLAVVGDGCQLIFSGFGRNRHSDSLVDRDSLPRSNLQKFDGRILCHCPSAQQ